MTTLGNTPINLAAIADGKANIPPDQRFNIRALNHNEATPRFRRLTKVYWERENNRRWLMWRWTPEPTGDSSTDCGYSGIAEDAPDINVREITLLPQP